MARCLFTCHDAGGTVPPVLAAAKAMLGRGHDVTILSQPSVQRRAVALGSDFLSFSEIEDYRRDVVLEEQLDRVVPALTGPSVASDLIAAARKSEADVLVVDPNLSGALAAAEVLDLPSAVLLHSLYRTFVDVWFGELWALLAEPINATRRGLGVEEAGSWADTLARHDLIVSPVPDEFDAPTPSAPGVLRHVGFLVPSAESDAPIELPPGDEPLVVVSFSTTYQRQEHAIAATLAALADEEVRVIATTSGYAGAPASPTNAVIAEFVPHASLFESAELVISHAGLGTTAAALHAGVPLLCIPMGRDQALNAARVAELGAGVVHAADSDGEAMRHSIRDVLSHRNYRRAAERVAEWSRIAGEEDAAAAAIENLLN